MFISSVDGTLFDKKGPSIVPKQEDIVMDFVTYFPDTKSPDAYIQVNQYLCSDKYPECHKDTITKFQQFIGILVDSYITTLPKKSVDIVKKVLPAALLSYLRKDNKSYKKYTTQLVAFLLWLRKTRSNFYSSISLPAQETKSVQKSVQKPVDKVYTRVVKKYKNNVLIELPNKESLLIPIGEFLNWSMAKTKNEPVTKSEPPRIETKPKNVPKEEPQKAKTESVIRLKKKVPKYSMTQEQESRLENYLDEFHSNVKESTRNVYRCYLRRFFCTGERNGNSSLHEDRFLSFMNGDITLNNKTESAGISKTALMDFLGSYKERKQNIPKPLKDSLCKFILNKFTSDNTKNKEVIAHLRDNDLQFFSSFSHIITKFLNECCKGTMESALECVKNVEKEAPHIKESAANQLKEKLLSFNNKLVNLTQEFQYLVEEVCKFVG